MVKASAEEQETVASIALDCTAMFFDYVIVNGKRTFITRVNQCTSFACDGLNLGMVKERVYGTCSKSHSQSGTVVGMWLWELEEYIGPDTALPSLIDLAWILNHITLKSVSIGSNCKKVWVTVDLVKRINLEGIYRNRKAHSMGDSAYGEQSILQACQDMLDHSHSIHPLCFHASLIIVLNGIVALDFLEEGSLLTIFEG
ncbi:hypothetical protein V8B97DRAFT_1920440 [Scleroderma yunnanense]